MYRREARRGGNHKGSPASSMQWVPKSESPVTVDRKSQEDIIDSTKQSDEGDAVKCCVDDKVLLQSHASSSLKDLNLSGGVIVFRNCEDIDGDGTHCGLVNRSNDVMLSRKGLASSTSDEKVEISSVGDRDGAHKACNAGTNENKMAPFDIFLETNVMRLKASKFEVNREKRKAAKACFGIVLRPGMVLLKNYLSIKDQVMILNKCRHLGLGKGGFYQPGYNNEAKLCLKMMCLGKNWDCQTSKYGETRPFDGSVPPQIPLEFSELVGKAIKESQSVICTNSKKTSREDDIPFMSPDICIVNFYTATGRLGLHKDKDESKESIRKGLPVVSFSVGDSAEFLYGDHGDVDKAEMVVLESGDVLLFGGQSRNVFHGVRSIIKDTAPKVLVHETRLQPGRLNLTFRQY
ncbi:unnamed protein product [Cochlearia groenlandica]